MRKFTLIFISILLILFIGLPVKSIVLANGNKIDPVFRIYIDAKKNPVESQGRFKVFPGSKKLYLGAILRFKGDLSKVEQKGGKIRSVLGDIATVDIPIDVFEEISQLSEVIYIEAPRKVHRKLDKSVSATGADLLRTGVASLWKGNTGRNVIIGMVDTGIDITHGDFKDSSGNTRILYLWDRSINGTPPSGKSVGHECDSVAINEGSCSSNDKRGHGTHVAGIAAGNGASTGNNKDPYRFVGMAPEASLIVVKESFLADALDTSNDSILDGISYIQEKAALLGLPSVINLSLGSQMGPHDGTSNYERGLNNASGAGKIIVASAGNEASADIHASVVVSKDETKQLELYLPEETKEVFITGWYAGSDQISFKLGDGSNECVTDWVEINGSYSSDTACGHIDIAASGISPLNGDMKIYFYITPNSNGLLRSGVWRLDVLGVAIVNGRLDLWSGEYEGDTYFTTYVDSSMTLIDTANAKEVISVAAYNTKSFWSSIAGMQFPNSDNDPFNDIPLNDIAYFSSSGPRRNCSLVAECPDLQKPEITAPGSMIFSSLAIDRTGDPLIKLEPDGTHVGLEGTSMSAPHVTGGVALILQAAPELTPDEVKKLLIENTYAADQFTGSLPNNRWGYGIMDIKGAFDAVDNLLPTAPASLMALSSGVDVTVSWKANTEIDIDGYEIFRGFEIDSLSKVATLPYNVTHYSESLFSTDTLYYYGIKAIDSAGRTSETTFLEVVPRGTTDPSPSDNNDNGNVVLIDIPVASPESGGGCFITAVSWFF